jgi:hypothetical protein
MSLYQRINALPPEQPEPPGLKINLLYAWGAFLLVLLLILLQKPK